MSIAYARIDMAILYRGVAQDDDTVHPEEAPERERQRQAAEMYFGVSDALLDVVADPDSYAMGVEARIPRL